MATIGIDGCVLHVQCAPGAVVIADEVGLSAARTLGTAQARELVDLLDAALSVDASHGLIGSVPTVRGGVLHVKRWPTAVSISDHPTTHSGWTLRLRDQVEALRDVIADAAGVDAPQEQTAPADA